MKKIVKPKNLKGGFMIEIINTGGTFNKRYNPISGELEVPADCFAVKNILSKAMFFNQKIKITQLISKDSLEFTKKDRKLLLEAIQNSKSDKLIVIHGTDTMHKSSKFVAENMDEKIVVFTGAMKPYEIEKVEAVANLMMGIGFLQNCNVNGVYISMHGVVMEFDKLKKDYKKGFFKKS